MTKNDYKFAGFLVGLVAIATLVGVLVLNMPLNGPVEPYRASNEPSLTQKLIEGPPELKISCHDDRGVEHKLFCSVNTDVHGIWVIFEIVNGKPQSPGLVSRFLVNEWSLRVGSHNTPEVYIVFFPNGNGDRVELYHTLDTEYMRQGIRNFPGDPV